MEFKAVQCMKMNAIFKLPITLLTFQLTDNQFPSVVRLRLGKGSKEKGKWEKE